MREKLWTQEFDNLLNELEAEYGGKIKTSVTRGKGVTGSADISIWEYPEFRTDYKSRRIEVNISERPSPHVSDFSSAVDEFLCLVMFGKFSAHFHVTHERLFDRFKKFLKLDREFQTGHSEFDATYYLSPGNDEARAVLANSEAQAIIRQLEPFAVLTVREGSVFLSSGINSTEQLSRGKVERTLNDLIKLAELIP